MRVLSCADGGLTVCVCLLKEGQLNWAGPFYQASEISAISKSPLFCHYKNSKLTGIGMTLVRVCVLPSR